MCNGFHSTFLHREVHSSNQVTDLKDLKSETPIAEFPTISIHSGRVKTIINPSQPTKVLFLCTCPVLAIQIKND